MKSIINYDVQTNIISLLRKFMSDWVTSLHSNKRVWHFWGEAVNIPSYFYYHLIISAHRIQHVTLLLTTANWKICSNLYFYFLLVTYTEWLSDQLQDLLELLFATRSKEKLTEDDGNILFVSWRYQFDECIIRFSQSENLQIWNISTIFIRLIFFLSSRALEIIRNIQKLDLFWFSHKQVKLNWSFVEFENQRYLRKLRYPGPGRIDMIGRPPPWPGRTIQSKLKFSSNNIEMWLFDAIPDF